MVVSEHETQWLQTKGKAMMHNLGISTGNAVIDFGCGEGRYSIPLSQAVGAEGKVYSFERDQEPLCGLKERVSLFDPPNNIVIKESDNFEVSSVIEHNSIDAVLLFDVLQYVADWQRLFSQLSIVLKKEGRLHIYPAVVPHPGSVEIEAVKTVLRSLGYKHLCSTSYEMMHSVDMVKDTVHSYLVRD